MTRLTKTLAGPWTADDQRRLDRFLKEEHDMTEITSDTSPRTVACALDSLGIEYHPADLAIREIRDPDDQPQEIETLTTGRGIGGLLLRRDDDGWSWYNRRTRSSGSLDSMAELKEQLALA